MMCTSEKKDHTAAPAMRRITRCKILFSDILCVIVVVVDEGEGRGKARFERVRDATQDLQMRQLAEGASHYVIRPFQADRGAERDS